MSKDAYYFSHDSNARNDPKILAMRSVYKAEGYGWYFMLLEIFREDANYKIAINKYTYDTLAMQLQCERNAIESFVDDCCINFVDSHGSLLSRNEDFIWSESFLKRMADVDGKREKNRASANKRWQSEADLPLFDANAMQTQSDGNANGMLIKESKVSKVKKEKDSSTKKSSNGKIEYQPEVFLKKEEYESLVKRFGREGTEKRLVKLSLYVLSKGVKYKSHYHTVLSWEQMDQTNPRTIKQNTNRELPKLEDVKDVIAKTQERK
jgi:hypothetical protein